MSNRMRLCALAAAVCVLLSGCKSKDGGESNKDKSAAENTGSSSFSDSSGSEGTGISDMYDVSPIVEAYHSGDTSALSQLDLDIYNKACTVLDEIITDGMGDYEKELAVHDWLVYNCTYDSGSLSAIPNPSENCDNPYGALINGQAICKGYTTAFRMFMGMLGIPCGTVHSADTDGDEHAWNTVKLDGSWYYVDCTWDDPVPDFDGRPVTHKYFNISREEISERHVLPEGTPETDSLENSWYSRSAVKISSLDEIYTLAARALVNDISGIVFVFDDSLGISFNEYDSIDGFYIPEDERLSEVIDGLYSALAENGIVGESGYVNVRRVQTSQGIGLLVEVSQFG